MNDAPTTPATPGPRGCHGLTKTGKPCGATARADGYCLVHGPQDAPERQRFGGPQEGSGPKPRPRPHDVLREMIESELEVWLAPYRQAVTEAVVTATFEGEVIPSTVADLGARIAAAEKVLDRVYGKPTQRQELEHGGVVNVDAVFGLAPTESGDTLPSDEADA